MCTLAADRSEHHGGVLLRVQEALLVEVSLKVTSVMFKGACRRNTSNGRSARNTPFLSRGRVIMQVEVVDTSTNGTYFRKKDSDEFKRMIKNAQTVLHLGDTVEFGGHADASSGLRSDHSQC